MYISALWFFEAIATLVRMNYGTKSDHFTQLFVMWCPYAKN